MAATVWLKGWLRLGVAACTLLVSPLVTPPPALATVELYGGACTGMQLALENGRLITRVPATCEKAGVQYEFLPVTGLLWGPARGTCDGAIELVGTGYLIVGKSHFINVDVAIPAGSVVPFTFERDLTTIGAGTMRREGCRLSADFVFYDPHT